MNTIYYTITPNSQGNYTIKLYSTYATGYDINLNGRFELESLISVEDDVIDYYNKNYENEQYKAVRL